MIWSVVFLDFVGNYNCIEYLLSWEVCEALALWLVNPQQLRLRKMGVRDSAALKWMRPHPPAGKTPMLASIMYNSANGFDSRLLARVHVSGFGQRDSTHPNALVVSEFSG